MFVKKMISKIICFILLGIFSQNIVFADTVKVIIKNNVNITVWSLSLLQVNEFTKERKEIFHEDRIGNAMFEKMQDFFVFNGTTIDDEKVIEQIVSLSEQYKIVDRKLNISLYFPDGCPVEDEALFDGTETLDSLCDEKDRLFENIISLIKENAKVVSDLVEDTSSDSDENNVEELPAKKIKRVHVQFDF